MHYFQFSLMPDINTVNIKYSMDHWNITIRFKIVDNWMKDYHIKVTDYKDTDYSLSKVMKEISDNSN